MRRRELLEAVLEQAVGTILVYRGDLIVFGSRNPRSRALALSRRQQVAVALGETEVSFLRVPDLHPSGRAVAFRRAWHRFPLNHLTLTFMVLCKK